MRSQVISFLRQPRRGSDWSPDEIAELYRIEHALLQARISLHTDRGVTDEGDPWFVFCRSDGEVLVHITRFDGQYYLYSSGLSSPLTGRLFTELSKSFVQQISLQFPLRRGDGAQLFVHPAAMLAIIIGTIFVASDDLYLLSADPDQARDQTDGAAAGADGGTLKMALQGAFHKYFDGLVGNVRSELTNVQSAYLNVICAIATFVVGTSVASDIDQSHSVVPAVLEASEQQPNLSHGVLISLDDSDLGWRWDDAGPKEHIQVNHLAENKVIVLDGDTQDISTTSPVPSAHSELKTSTEDQFASRLHFDVGGESIPVSETANLAKGDEGLTQVATSNLSHLISFQVSSATPPTNSVLVTDSVALGQDNLAASIAQLLHHGLAPSTMPVAQENSLIALVSNSAADAHFAPESNSAADAHQIVPSPLNAVTVVTLPIFDAAAQNTLIKFLTSNPDFKVVYDHENVIVSDGHDTGGSQPTTVQIWELQSGATIAIVGHTDAVGHV